MFRILIIGCLFFCPILQAEIISPGVKGNYTTELPAHRQSVSKDRRYDLSKIENGVHPIIEDYVPVSPSFTKQFFSLAKPVTTHEFWSSVAWEFMRPSIDQAGNVPDYTFVKYSNVIFSHPFILKFNAKGLSLVYDNQFVLSPVVSERQETLGQVLPSPDNPEMVGFELHDSDPDIVLSIEGLNAKETLVDDYGDWTVRVFWGDNEQKDYLKATFGYGFPYLYFEKEGLGDVVFTFRSNTRLWYENDGIVALIVESKRRNYAIFAPKDAVWEYTFEETDKHLRHVKSLKLKLPQNSKYFTVGVLPEEFNELMKVKNPNGIAPFGDMPELSFKQGTSLSEVPLHVEGTSRDIGATLFYQDYFKDFGGYFSQKGGYDPELKKRGIVNYEIDPLLPLLEFYQQHAFAYPINTKVSWEYDENLNQLETTYAVETMKVIDEQEYSDQPLIGLFPHQWKNPYVGNFHLLDFSYETTRGEMKLINDKQFSTTHEYPGVIPNLPNLLNEEEVKQLNQYLEEVVDPKNQEAPPFLFLPGIAHTYVSGKNLAKLAHLIPIAKQVGREDLAKQYLDKIKEVLEDWFDARDYVEDQPQSNGKNEVLKRYFYYDEEWNTLIGYPADFLADTELNDHHFHYGYFIMAAATVARYDNEWAQQYKGMVDLLIKDAANWERSDKQFPFLRNFDPYLGYSQANGHANFADGLNQESSSEGMNFATAVLLWGSEMNDPEIIDLGVFLYTLESESIRQYWYDVDRTNFPKDVWYMQPEKGWVKHDFNQPALGVVWSGKGHYSTWFHWAPYKIYGISFLPITGGSLYLARMQEKIMEIMDKLPEANDLYYRKGDAPAYLASRKSWSDIIWQVLALQNPNLAVDLFEKNKDYKWELAHPMPEDPENPPLRGEKGETKAHTYHWIFNLQHLGRLNTEITADTLHYAVFDRETGRYYIVYNPTDVNIDVNFSDGITVEVPSNSLKVFDEKGRMMD